MIILVTVSTNWFQPGKPHRAESIFRLTLQGEVSISLFVVVDPFVRIDPVQRYRPYSYTEPHSQDGFGYRHGTSSQLENRYC
jgi:hypothetical protein